jgi:hypothetical protein
MLNFELISQIKELYEEINNPIRDFICHLQF